MYAYMVPKSSTNLMEHMEYEQWFQKMIERGNQIVTSLVISNTSSMLATTILVSSSSSQPSFPLPSALELEALSS